MPFRVAGMLSFMKTETASSAAVSALAHLGAEGIFVDKNTSCRTLCVFPKLKRAYSVVFI